MTKIRLSLSVDEQVAGQLARVASKKGISNSEVAENYLIKGLSKEVELTTLERMTYQNQCLNLALDSMLLLYNCTVSGDFEQKFGTLIALNEGFSASIPLREVKRVAEISIFELLRDLEEYNKPMHEKIVKNFKKNLKQRYLSVYSVGEKA